LSKEKQQSAEFEHIALEFKDNKLASQLFGQYDQHLAMLEQQLGVEAVARGNEVNLKGESTAIRQARVALEHLYARLEAGDTVEQGDVDGAIRMAAADNQLSLPGTEKTSTLSMAKIGTRKKVLSRPAVEAGERLGFLPGDMKDKVDPYLRPLYDALYDMIPGDQVERALTAGTIEIAPLAFMRGRTLSNAAVILDEAQNTTSMQMKMFLTRLGENSRMIVTGDPSQVDLPGGVRSGLVEALDLLGGIKGVSRIRFSAKDVVRHRLVAEIVNAYDDVLRKKKKSDDTEN